MAIGNRPHTGCFASREGILFTRRDSVMCYLLSVAAEGSRAIDGWVHGGTVACPGSRTTGSIMGSRRTHPPVVPAPPPFPAAAACIWAFFCRNSEKIRWEKVGQLESDLCVHDMVSIGDGQQAIMFPAEQDKLLESLLAQVRV